MALLRLAHFKKTVTTAGTAEAISTSGLRPEKVVIQADPANTGKIFVGDSTVSSTNCFVSLAAGEKIELDIGDFDSGATGWDMDNIYIDASVSGEGVFVGYTARN